MELSVILVTPHVFIIESYTVKRMATLTLGQLFSRLLVSEPALTRRYSRLGARNQPARLNPARPERGTPQRQASETISAKISSRDRICQKRSGFR